MRAFGRDVVIQTLAGVLTAWALLVIPTAWASVKFGVPLLVASFQVSGREALGWALVVAMVPALLVIAIYAATLTRQWAPRFTLESHGGVKPCVTLKHSGAPRTYRVDGQIETILDNSPNPWPAPFQCELHVHGNKPTWEALLSDGDWANVVLGSLEPVYAHGSMGDSYEVGRELVIRRGKQGSHVDVPDAGATVALSVRTSPESTGIKPRRFSVVRDIGTDGDVPSAVEIQRRLE